MDVTGIVALGGLIIGSIGAILQIIKWWTERSEKQNKSIQERIKEASQKDSMVVASANEALTMMQGMLAEARQTEARLRIRNEALEAENEQLERQCREKDRRIYDLERQLRDAQR